MNRHLPVPQSAPVRVIHYVDPTNPAAGVQVYTPHEVATRRHHDRILYARWLARRHAQAEHDRRVRRFMVGFGAVTALAVLAAVAAAGWLIWHALATIAVGALAVPLMILLLAGLLLGGHRCITIVQHWH